MSVGLQKLASRDQAEALFAIKTKLWVRRSFGMIRISDPRSLSVKRTEQFILVEDLSVLLMHSDPSGLGSLILIQITPKEPTHYNTETKLILTWLKKN